MTERFIAAGRAEDRRCHLWALRESPDWISLKLVLDGGGKTNYWFSWSTVEQRFSRSSDFEQLSDSHPGILSWCAEQLLA